MKRIIKFLLGTGFVLGALSFVFCLGARGDDYLEFILTLAFGMIMFELLELGSND
jgi:hypothetical protein